MRKDIEDKYIEAGFERSGDVWHRDEIEYTEGQDGYLVPVARPNPGRGGTFEGFSTPKVSKKGEQMERVKAEIVPSEERIQPAIVRPVVSVKEALSAWKEFQSLKKELLTGDDYYEVKGKKHINKSGCFKFATMFNLADEIVRSWREDENDGNFAWFIETRVIGPNGRSVTAVGACSTEEREFAHRKHDVFATASTRSYNRACLKICGSGELSAEELK